MNSKKCRGRIILVVVSLAALIGLVACEEKDQQKDRYEATDSNDYKENTESQENTYYDEGNDLNDSSNTSSDTNQNSISDTISSITSEEQIEESSGDKQATNSGFDYVSSDEKWAVNKSFFKGEVNGQTVDCMLYTTDISDQYYGDLITEVTILYSENIIIYLDLNMSKLETNEYTEDDFYNFDQGAVAKILYTDDRVIDNSGWMLPAPYCYYHVVTGVTEENEITKMFDSISLKVDYIDYNKDIICAYLSFSGPDVNGDLVSLDGYFAADLPFIAPSDINVIDNGSNDYNPSQDSVDSDTSSGFVDYVPSCSVCFGTGTCQTCLGDGWWYNGLTGDPMICHSCDNENGLCWHCNGTGNEPQ